MKKLIALLLTLAMVLTFAACAPADDKVTTEGTTEGTTESTTEGNTEDTAGASATVMSYAEFLAADVDDIVCVETYVQATESWWEDKIAVYSQNQEGAYYLYGLACTEEDAAKLVPGTKIRVTGEKANFNGEVEIMNGTFEFVEGGDTYIAEALDVTAKAGTAELEQDMNKLVSFKGATVAASKDADGNEAAYLYKWDGSGAQGDDLYFNVSIGETVYTFTVNVYMLGTGVDSDTYKAVEALKVGDKIDIEGFLYWYNGAQTHVTAISAAA